MLRFLVVGTLRSGTAYTAQVFCRMGVACGHGWVFNPERVRLYPEFPTVGDAAPLAAPLLGEFGGLVLHQVRDPLRVIGSLVGSAAIQNPLTEGSVGEFLAHHFVGTGDLLADAMRYYTEWNTRCERHNGYLRYRVEDLDADLLLRICDMIGQEVERATIATALDSVPTDSNAHLGSRPISWTDLPAGSSRDALARLAARYGYAVPELKAG